MPPSALSTPRPGRLALRTGVLAYLALLLLAPVLLVGWRVVSLGWDRIWSIVTDPLTLHALWLTIAITCIAVPVNAVFGVAAAIVLARHRFHGQTLLNALIDMPFAISPVIVGLSLVLLFGRQGWFGGFLTAHGIEILYALPAMVFATVIVSLPFVVREVAPLLREVGDEAEQAALTLGASSWQTFWRITFPTIRSGLGYGIVLATARSLGEFGAVSVVSGALIGSTETLTTHISDRVDSFDNASAYVSAALLALLSVAVLIGMRILQPREHRA